MKKYAISLMKEKKSFEYTEGWIRKLRLDIYRIVRNDLGGNVALEKIIEHLLRGTIFEKEEIKL